MTHLGEKISRLMENKTPDKRIVYIKSGIEVDYGTVVNAINEIRKQDIDKIGLVADKKKGVRRRNLHRNKLGSELKWECQLADSSKRGDSESST